MQLRKLEVTEVSFERNSSGMHRQIWCASFRTCFGIRLRLSFTMSGKSWWILFIDVACEWTQLLLRMLRACVPIPYTNKLRSLCE